MALQLGLLLHLATSSRFDCLQLVNLPHLYFLRRRYWFENFPETNAGVDALLT